MAHDHAHHHHVPASDGPLVWAIVLNVLLTLVEVVAGVLSGSLALIADGLHNLGDAGSLVVALVGRRVSKKPADERNTFGYKRADVVGAQANLILLIVMAVFLLLDGVERLLDPQPVMGLVVMIVAFVALVIDLASVWLTARLSGESMGSKVAMIHHIADAGSSLGAIAGGALVYFFDWWWVDTAIAFAIAGYMGWQAWSMVGHSTGILMQGVPADLDPVAVAAELSAIDGVRKVHHLHIWSLDPQTIMLEAHVVTDCTMLADAESIKHAIRERCGESWDIHHTTLEFETPATAQREATQNEDHGRLIPRH